MKMKKENLFSKAFLSIKPSLIAKALRDEGYYFFSDALTQDTVKKILSEVGQYGFVFNTNDVGLVQYKEQVFFSNILAGSKTTANLVVSNTILEISRSFLKRNFRLKCQRYYESKYKYSLGWHVDNKTVNDIKTSTNGLVFIFYLNDTFDGYLEAIRSSNAWSRKLKDTNFNDAIIQNQYKPEIRSFPGKAGSVIITDISTVHREKKIEQLKYIKKSLFIQIDDDMHHSEKIIICPHFFYNFNKKVKEFLGFGMDSGYKTQPNSSINSMSLRSLIKIEVKISAAIAKKIISFFLNLHR